jgi:glycosyltransferase involved in cell wall biosynthesis
MNNVTIVTPLYKQSQYLGECVDSVLAQTHQNWNMIIVEDCGTKDDYEEAERQAKRDKRISVIHHLKNMGLSAARNTGIMASKGNYIQLLDADDFIHKGKLSKQLKEKGDIIFSDFYHRHQGQDTLGISDLKEDAFCDFLTRWERGLCIAIHSFLIKKSVFDKVGLFDESLPNHEDWDFHLRCAKEKFSYSYISEPLAYYRIHDDSMCRNTDMELGRKIVLERYSQ